MPIAVELTLDGQTAEHIRHLWRLIDKQHLHKHHPEFTTAPHITLGVYDNATEGVLPNLARKFAALQGPYGISFSSLGIFKSFESTLFLAPRVDEEMLNIHKTWHRIAKDVPLPTHSHYRHDRWEPHITLGMDLKIKQLIRAYQAIADHDLPHFGTIVGIRLVKFSPTQILLDVPLGETYVEVTHNN